MSGCGHDGPWSHVISYAPTIHAICGITHLTNFADRGDVGPGFSLNDHLAGFAAATSTVAALLARDVSGKGQHIDMAQLEVGTYSIGPAALDCLTNGIIAEPHGNQDGLHDHVPNEVFRTSDGFVAISATNNSEWERLCELIGDPRLISDISEKERRSQRSLINEAINDWVKYRTSSEVERLAQEAHVPAGRVQNAGDLLEDDPQLADRGFWRQVDHDVFGERTIDSFPALIDGVRPPTERLSPSYLGEHNFEVWTELSGLEPEAVAEGIGDDLFS